MKIEGVELIEWKKPVLSEKERIKKKSDKNRKINENKRNDRKDSILRRG